MKMYVANASIQNIEFHYRISEQSKVRTQTILPMSQIILTDDLTPGDVVDIVEQHERYGFVSIEDLKNGRITKERTSLVYSVDAPISSIMINYLFDTNKGILSEFGKKIRAEAAIVSNDRLIQTLSDATRYQGVDAEVRDVEMSVEEIENKDGGNHPEPVVENILVSANPDRIPARRRRG